MNVLTKTCRGFVKRVAAYIVAGTVAATLIPAAVSAEETAAAPTLWETVSEISMDGFTKTKSGSWMVAGEKTVGERTVTVQTNAGGDPWIVCPNSGFCDVASDADLAVNAPEIAENGKLFVLDRHNGENGWWRPTSIQSGIQALNLFDFLVIDLLWWRHTKRVRFSGTEESPELYADPRKHFYAFLRGVLLFLAVALINGYLLTWI